VSLLVVFIGEKSERQGDCGGEGQCILVGEIRHILTVSLFMVTEIIAEFFNLQIKSAVNGNTETEITNS
jgi:hypothetical protein